MIEEENLQRISSAKVKLNHIFKEQFCEFEKRKKETMHSQEVQVKI